MVNKDNGQTNSVNPFLQHKSHIGGFAFSLATLLFILAGVTISVIIAFAGIEKGTSAYVYLGYLGAPLGMIPAMAITLKYKKTGVKSVFPVKCNPKYYAIALLLIFGLIFSVSWIDTGVTELFKLLGYQPKSASDYLPDLSGGLIVPALIVIAVMPAIFEEGLFRGVILNTCEESLGTVNTIFVVGFAFALFHASAEQTVYQFISGCVFAFLAIRAGAILPSVLMHFINNGLIIVFGACGLLDESGSAVLPQTVQIVLIVTSAVCFVGGMLWLILDKKPLKKSKKGGAAAFFVYASVGIVILSISWISSFFIR